MSENLLATLAPELDWLRHSGIQAPDGATHAGGVRAWIDEENGRPAYVYSEITGYFVTLCAHLARFDSERQEWLERGAQAASWIVRCALDENGALLARAYDEPEASATDPYSFDNRRVLFFDSAMVGYGLVALYRATGEDVWLDAARRMGDFMRRAFEAPDRRVRYAAYDLREGSHVPAGPRWSQHFGSFELKGAMFLDSLSDATGDESYRGMAERILTSAAPRQHACGRFPTDLGGEATHLHPHCYTIEGLLYLVARRGRRELLEPAFRALNWMFETCLRPESLIQQWSRRPELLTTGMRSDALAQALRARHVVALLEPEAAWPWDKAVPVLESILDDYRLPSGGTCYGEDEHGRKARHANAWCHFFGIEMRIYRWIREKQLAFAPEDLLIT